MLGIEVGQATEPNNTNESPYSRHISGDLARMPFARTSWHSSTARGSLPTETSAMREAIGAPMRMRTMTIKHRRSKENRWVALSELAHLPSAVRRMSTNVGWTTAVDNIVFTVLLPSFRTLSLEGPVHPNVQVTATAMRTGRLAIEPRISNVASAHTWHETASAQSSF